MNETDREHLLGLLDTERGVIENDLRFAQRNVIEWEKSIVLDGYSEGRKSFLDAERRNVAQHQMEWERNERIRQAVLVRLP